MDKRKLSNLSLFGAILAGIGASLCCIGPALLALLSIGGAGAFSKFENARPLFVAITLVLLATAFYLTYRKKETKCEDGTCRIEGAGRWNKFVLWLATFIIFLAIAFPYFNNFTFSKNGQIQSATEVEVKEVVIHIQGMTCGGCAFRIESEIKKLGGIYEVKADYKKGTVYIKFDPRKVNVEDIKKEIYKAGYKAL